MVIYGDVDVYGDGAHGASSTKLIAEMWPVPNVVANVAMQYLICIRYRRMGSLQGIM